MAEGCGAFGQEVYRVVNGQDVVARLPRTLSIVDVNYAHAGRTVLVAETVLPCPFPEDPCRDGVELYRFIPSHAFQRMSSGCTSYPPLFNVFTARAC